MFSPKIGVFFGEDLGTLTVWKKWSKKMIEVERIYSWDRIQSHHWNEYCQVSNKVFRCRMAKRGGQQEQRQTQRVWEQKKLPWKRAFLGGKVIVYLWNRTVCLSRNSTRRWCHWKKLIIFLSTSLLSYTTTQKMRTRWKCRSVRFRTFFRGWY